MKVGLIAGWGDLPLTFAREAYENNQDLVIVAIKSSASKEIEKYGKTYWFSFTEAQKIIDTFKNENVKNLVMLGRVDHKSILFHFYKFDERAKRFLNSLKDKRAKSILHSIIQELEKEGFEFIDPTPYLKSIIVEEGFLVNDIKDENLKKDVEFGMKIAKEVADLDIGQTVVVKDGVVIAVEGVEGTDECIIRGGKLAGEGSVVCKAARKNQDMRYDVPVIGPLTLESMKKAKAKVLAVEAGKTYLLEKDKFIRKAKDYGITVLGVKV
ncbi:MAG: LpxI family protein [Sulfurihydrogenibium sp.]|uniref:LpxI family protein n=1 Tax=Sulfurihydrogenibium sp. TaxID=2053621 RepID=UPI003D0DC15B